MPVHPTAPEDRRAHRLPARARHSRPRRSGRGRRAGRARAAAVDDCIGKHVRAICVISAGFSECDAEGRAREAVLVERIRQAGCRLIGPNCMGLLNTDPAVRLNATFSPVYPPAGTVAMSTQSGALGPGDPRLREAARHRHLELRLGRQQGGRLGQRSDSGTGPTIRGRPSSCSISRASGTRRSSARSPGAWRAPSRSSPSSRDARRPDRARPPPIPARWHRATRSSMRSFGRPASSGPNGSKSCSTWRRCSRINRSRAAAAWRSSRTPADRESSPPTPARRTGSSSRRSSEATRAELRSFLPAAASVGNPVDMLASAPPDHYRRALDGDPAGRPRRQRDRDLHSAARDRADAVASAIAEGRARCRRQAGAGRVHARGGRAGDAGADSLLRVSRIRGAGAREGDRVRPVASEPAEPPPAWIGSIATRIRAIVERVLGRGGGWATAGKSSACCRPPASKAPRRVSRRPRTMRCGLRAAVGYPVALKALGPTLLHKTERRAVSSTSATKGACAPPMRTSRRASATR